MVPAPPTITPTAPVPLTSLAPGQTAVIREARLGTDDAALLRAMGLTNNMRIKLCRVGGGGPCVVALGSTEGRHCHCHGHCRIGLARGLADRIFVTVLA